MYFTVTFGLFLLKVALGESKNNVTEPIQLYVTVGSDKLLIGTLSHEKFPQLSTEIVLERNFALSHTWKNGSVFFSGYKVDASDPYPLLFEHFCCYRFKLC
jgi:hypothetical protein